MTLGERAFTGSWRERIYVYVPVTRRFSLSNCSWPSAAGLVGDRSSGGVEDGGTRHTAGSWTVGERIINVSGPFAHALLCRVYVCVIRRVVTIGRGAMLATLRY